LFVFVFGFQAALFLHFGQIFRWGIVANAINVSRVTFWIRFLAEKIKGHFCSDWAVNSQSLEQKIQQSYCSCILRVQRTTLKRNVILWKKFLFLWSFSDSEQKTYGLSLSNSRKFCQNCLLLVENNKRIRIFFSKYFVFILFSEFEPKKFRHPSKRFRECCRSSSRRLERNIWRERIYPEKREIMNFFDSEPNDYDILSNFSGKDCLNWFLSVQKKFWGLYLE